MLVCFALADSLLDEVCVAVESLLEADSLGLLLAFDNSVEALVSRDFLEPFFTEDLLLPSDLSPGVDFTFCAIFAKEVFPNVLLGVSEPLRDEELRTRRGRFCTTFEALASTEFPSGD